MKHTIKLLTLAAILTAVFGLTGCPGPVNNYIEPIHEHVWTEVTTEYVAPTCTAKGSKTYVCSLCGETKVEELNALGHHFGDGDGWSSWTTTKNVAYNHDGEKKRTRTCTRCGYSETEKVTVSRFVAGGYDGDIPTDVENPETYRYQYNGNNDYQISAYVYSSVDDVNTDNYTVLYFSFPKNVVENGYITFDGEDPQITIDDLIHLKNGYGNKSVLYFRSNKNSLTEKKYKHTSKFLKDLDTDSPVYIVLEPITNE